MGRPKKDYTPFTGDIWTLSAHEAYDLIGTAYETMRYLCPDDMEQIWTIGHIATALGRSRSKVRDDLARLRIHSFIVWQSYGPVGLHIQVHPRFKRNGMPTYWEWGDKKGEAP